jgi:hypothetical protein
LDAFRNIAYINIKKIAGTRKSIDKVLKEAYERDKNILMEQINAYNPNLIIGGNTLHYFENDLDFRMQKKNQHFSEWGIITTFAIKKDYTLVHGILLPVLKKSPKMIIARKYIMHFLTGTTSTQK